MYIKIKDTLTLMAPLTKQSWCLNYDDKTYFFLISFFSDAAALLSSNFPHLSIEVLKQFN